MRYTYINAGTGCVDIADIQIDIKDRPKLKLIIENPPQTIGFQHCLDGGLIHYTKMKDGARDDAGIVTGTGFT